MKKFMKVAAMMLVAIFVLAACGGNGGGAADPTPAPVATPTPAPTPTPQPVEQDQLAMEPITLTIHYVFDNQVWQDDWLVWQQIADLTGVTLVGVADPTNTVALEAFNLAAVDGFPADIYGGTLAVHFMNRGVEGAFIPLNDYIESYAPNFFALMERFPEIREAITAPDGNIYHMPNLNDVFDSFAASMVYWMRMDWLEMVGMDMPNTWEEYEAVLVAFRDEIPEMIGEDMVVPFFANNMVTALQALAPFWGARATGNETGIRLGQMEDRDEIVHFWIQPEFRTAVENISR